VKAVVERGKYTIKWLNNYGTCIYMYMYICDTTWYTTDTSDETIPQLTFIKASGNVTSNSSKEDEKDLHKK
jgi:hypothetical protein